MFFNPANIIVFLQERFSDNFQTEISHEERKFFLSFKNIFKTLFLKTILVILKIIQKNAKMILKKWIKEKIKNIFNLTVNK